MRLNHEKIRMVRYRDFSSDGVESTIPGESAQPLEGASRDLKQKESDVLIIALGGGSAVFALGLGIFLFIKRKDFKKAVMRPSLQRRRITHKRFSGPSRLDIERAILYNTN